jgi:hypothetical protein
MSFARGGNAGYDTYSTGPEYSSFTTHPASMKAGVLSQMPNTSSRPLFVPSAPRGCRLPAREGTGKVYPSIHELPRETVWKLLLRTDQPSHH